MMKKMGSKAGAAGLKALMGGGNPLAAAGEGGADSAALPDMASLQQQLGSGSNPLAGLGRGGLPGLGGLPGGKVGGPLGGLPPGPRRGRKK